MAPPEQRRAAARALGGTLDDDGRQRLRVAAERCAEPGARRTLLRVARGEPDDDAEALAEIEAARDQPTARAPGR